MAESQRRTPPQNYFLNETHELASIGKAGGGRAPEYVNVSWAEKSKRVSESLERTIENVTSSDDPLRAERYFVVAKPVKSIEKKSSDKKRAKDGVVKDEPFFGGDQGKVFDRLGLDLLQVTTAGDAIVHGNRERVEQLIGRSKSLEQLGSREQARWIAIDSFESVPLGIRIDNEWLRSLKSDQLAEVVFELQPVLGRVDADRVLRAISERLNKQGERLTGTGTDFSGRYWFRGKASQGSLRSIARSFYSVQSIHSPLYSYAAATGQRPRRALTTAIRDAAQDIDADNLPCVAILDLGVPTDHPVLAPYRRGRFMPQDASASEAIDHGSFVASRVIFGNQNSATQLSSSIGACSFYDVVVGEGYENRINDKVVMEALRGVRGAAPDVRVFNLSFGDTKPLGDHSEIDLREKRLLIQDMDNFAFATDSLIIVAAGNSPPGLIPNPAYPDHIADSRWGLGSWACGFNTLVCGSYVDRISADGLVKTAGWPSGFSRIGPGVTECPTPVFCAEGGNTDEQYRFRPGMGVWGFSAAGLAEDRCGTSFAAPILAREAALSIARLQEFCAPGSRPYAVLVKAFLALTAELTTTDAVVEDCAGRTLGFGKASARRISAPVGGSAVILWQGVIENEKDVVRVQFPVPRSWLAEAEEPLLRLFVCCDPPVNESAKSVWACRRVKVTVHPGPDERGISGTAYRHDSYPLCYREFKLNKFAPGSSKAAPTDMWIFEILYEEIFDYPPAMQFDSRQRVAIAAELIDRSDESVDPQPALQALPITASMVRLSAQTTAIRNPVILRTR